MTVRPDPGNPPQTLCVQYNGVTAFDGVTESLPYARPLVAPNAQNIIEIAQDGPLGLIDPDGGTGGSQGDRFILWIEVVLESAANLVGQVVDGEETDLVLTNPIPVQAVSDVFYLGTAFRIPQGGLLRLSTTPPVGGRVRYRPALEPDECCTGSSGGGGGTSSIQHGSVGYALDGSAVTQTGSAGAFVNVLGTSTLDPPVGFSSSEDNALTYEGVAATFFIEAQANPNNSNIEEGPYQLRMTVNDVVVDESLVFLVIGETHRIMACSRMQVTLSPGDVVRAQIFAPPGGDDTTLSYFRLQAHQV